MKTLLFHLTVISTIANILAMDVDNFCIVAAWFLVNLVFIMVCYKVLTFKDVLKASGYKQFIDLIK